MYFTESFSLFPACKKGQGAKEAADARAQQLAAVAKEMARLAQIAEEDAKEKARLAQIAEEDAQRFLVVAKWEEHRAHRAVEARDKAVEKLVMAIAELGASDMVESVQQS